MNLKNRWMRWISYIIIIVIGVVYGYGFHKYHFFPYKQIKQLIGQDPAPYGPWSIGIYKGPTPFTVGPSHEIPNPILSGQDVTDIDAQFVADPFMLIKDDIFYLFFEAFNKESNQGDLSYAVSSNGIEWDYKQIIIDEEFHLAYPYVFEWDNDYYLIPDSRDFSVRLYRASHFPDEWVFIGELISGYEFIDNSIFRHNNKWWMFSSTGMPSGSVLNLYYSDSLECGWQAHSQNPLIKGNKNIARSGGRVIAYENKLYRFAQDCDPSYGLQIFVFQIVELSESSYKEVLVSEEPLISGSGEGWNKEGMHHIDLHKVGESWICSVDGRNR